MTEIFDLEQLHNTLINNDNIIIYIYANWCIDCKLYEMNIDQSFENIDASKVFKINQDKFILFCDEYKLKNLPTIAIMNKYDLVNKLGDGSALPHKLVNEFVKKYF